MSTRNPNLKYNHHMLEANIGLEKESLRIDAEGRLAQTKHPFPGDPHLDRDFSENQLEFITSIYATPAEVYDALIELHRQAFHTLQSLPTGPEYLWPFSNPPYIASDRENPPADFYGEDAWKTSYRNHLRQRYGTRLMLYSGIHFNYSFTEDFLAQIPMTQNEAYMNLCAWATRYAWLVVYLTSASPVLDPSFFDDADPNKKDFRKYASPRSSRIGYWNTFEPVLDYRDLDSYIRSIERYVEDGTLMYPAELYYPVRIKPAGRYDMNRLREDGINHIEIRVVDENPYSPIGIVQEDISFLHLLMVYLLYRAPQEFTEEEQRNALRDMKTAGLYDDRTLLSNGLSIYENAKDALCDIAGFYRKGTFTRVEQSYIRNALDYQRNKLRPGGRPAERIRADFEENYTEKGLALAKRHARSLLESHAWTAEM